MVSLDPEKALGPSVKTPFLPLFVSTQVTSSSPILAKAYDIVVPSTNIDHSSDCIAKSSNFRISEQLIEWS